MKTCNIGDTVYLKSGSPPWTVKGVWVDSTGNICSVDVVWISNGNLVRNQLPIQCLKSEATVHQENLLVVLNKLGIKS